MVVGVFCSLSKTAIVKRLCKVLRAWLDFLSRGTTRIVMNSHPVVDLFALFTFAFVNRHIGFFLCSKNN